MEQGKYHSHPQEGQEGGSGELEAGWPQLNPQGSDRANAFQSAFTMHFQTREGQEGDLEQPTWIYQGQIVPFQPECFL